MISGTEDALETHFSLNKLQLGWAVSSLILGCMAGNAVAGPLSDRLGRKKVLLLTAVLFTVSGLSTAVATSFHVLVASRIVCGMAVGMAILIAPVYIAEISPPAVRGRLVSFNQLNIVIGISAAFFSNYIIHRLFAAYVPEDLRNCDWRCMLGLEAAPAAVYFAMLLTVPESPRWLLGKGRQAEARAVLSKIHTAQQADVEFRQIHDSFAGGSNFAGFFNLFRREMGYVLSIALAIAFFQQITGINAILYYAPTIFPWLAAAARPRLCRQFWLDWSTFWRHPWLCG